MTRLPDEMRAVAIATPGGPEALTPTTRPRPSPRAGEILVRVAELEARRAFAQRDDVAGDFQTGQV